MVNLVKVRFTRNAVERVHGYVHPDNPSFEKGKVYPLKHDSAMHWLKRGAAEIVEANQEPKADANKVQARKAKSAPKADGNDASDKPSTDDNNKG